MAIDKKQLSSWLTTCETDLESSFFHTPYWYEVARKYHNCDLNIIKLNSESFIPTVSYRRGFRRHLIHESSPFGTYGGILGTSPITEDELSRSLYGKRIFIRSNPYKKDSVVNLLKTDQEEQTQVVYLPNSSESITDQWSTNHKRTLKKAESENLRFAFDKSKQCSDRFYSIYQLTLNRWASKKKNKHKAQLFRYIFNDCQNQVRFAFVSKGDNDLAAGIFFKWHDRLHYWSGASTLTGLNIGASVFLMHQIMMRCIDEKIQLLDFNPSNHIKGVINFKSKFGAKALSCNIKSIGF